MSNRFFAGPLTSGMGRKWDDWDAAEPVGAQTPVRRFGIAVSRPCLRLMPCPPLPTMIHDERRGHSINDPIAPQP
jgi:hypothetical protein